MTTLAIGTALSMGVQDGTYRPRGATRVVEVFDFEEYADGPGALPEGWIRGQHDPVVRERPGFYLWNQAGLDHRSHAYRGNGSVRLPVRGGNCSLMLRPGLIGAFPTADYTVRAYVRTDEVHHARGQLVVRMLDAGGEPIAASERRSPLLVSDDRWTEVSVPLFGDFGEAVFIQIELLALQAREFTDPWLPEPLMAYPEDFSGSVWFDEITITQTPRVELTSEADSNTMDGEEPGELRLFVRDLAGEQLSLDATVYDIDGRAVDARAWPMQGGQTTAAWRPDLPGRGWYRAVLRVRNGLGDVGSTELDFAWLPPATDVVGAPGGGSRDRGRFGAVLSRSPTEALPAYAELARRVGIGAVTMPALHAGEAMDADRIEALHRATMLLEDGVTDVTLSAPLARQRPAATGSALASLLNEDGDAWDPRFHEALDRFGQTTRRWQPGVEPWSLFTDHAEAAREIAAFAERLTMLVPGPVVSVPWPMAAGLPAEVLAGRRRLVLHATPGAGAGAYAELAADWNALTSETAATVDEPELTVVLPRGDARVSRRDRVSQMARDALAFWESFAPLLGDRPDAQPAGLPRMAIEDPVGWRGGRRPQVMPTPELAAWRTLIDTLADRRVAASFEIARGVRGLLLEPRDGASAGRGSAMAIWQEGPLDQPAEVDMLLAAGAVELVDLFGNARELSRTSSDDPGITRHRFIAGYEPVFIEGVDADLVLFQTGIRIEPDRLIARTGLHEHEVIVTNPWMEPIQGRFVIVEPGGVKRGQVGRSRDWNILPRVDSFIATSGSADRRTLQVGFSPSEEAGPKAFVLDVELDGRPEIGKLRVTRWLELELEEARLDLTYRRGPTPDGPDIVVEARVTNTSEAPLMIDLLGRADGYARDKTTITNLAPGETALRVFPFRGGAAVLGGKRVYVGMSIPETDARLRRSIEIAGPAPAESRVSAPTP